MVSLGTASFVIKEKPTQLGSNKVNLPFKLFSMESRCIQLKKEKTTKTTYIFTDVKQKNDKFWFDKSQKLCDLDFQNPSQELL